MSEKPDPLVRTRAVPRSLFGYLDNALVDLLQHAQASGIDPDVVRRKRRAFLQRVRRIVRDDRVRRAR